jgi:RNase P subunit RPR2
MDYYLLAFMLIILSGSVLVYIYYLKEKKEQLDSIKRGFCPKCKLKSIELTDQRSSGCSGPKILSFECLECGYINSFAVEKSSRCGTGDCSK